MQDNLSLQDQSISVLYLATLIFDLRTPVYAVWNSKGNLNAL